MVHTTTCCCCFCATLFRQLQNKCAASLFACTLKDSADYYKAHMHHAEQYYLIAKPLQFSTFPSVLLRSVARPAAGFPNLLKGRCVYDQTYISRWIIIIISSWANTYHQGSFSHGWNNIIMGEEARPKESAVFFHPYYYTLFLHALSEHMG